MVGVPTSGEEEEEEAPPISAAAPSDRLYTRYVSPTIIRSWRSVFFILFLPMERDCLRGGKSRVSFAFRRQVGTCLCYGPWREVQEREEVFFFLLFAVESRFGE